MLLTLEYCHQADELTIRFQSLTVRNTLQLQQAKQQRCKAVFLRFKRKRVLQLTCCDCHTTLAQNSNAAATTITPQLVGSQFCKQRHKPSCTRAAGSSGQYCPSSALHVNKPTCRQACSVGQFGMCHGSIQSANLQGLQAFVRHGATSTATQRDCTNFKLLTDIFPPSPQHKEMALSEASHVHQCWRHTTTLLLFLNNSVSQQLCGQVCRQRLV